MNTYELTITGMTCHACEQLITMDLEDAGLPAPESVDVSSGLVRIALQDDQFDAAKAAIESSGKYKVAKHVRV